MAITRRQFLKRTGGLTAGALLGPGLFGNPFVRRAMASTIGDRFFVVIFLDGGNDGLNTVIPATNGGGSLRDDYDVARDNITITPAQLSGTLIGTDPNTGAQLALRPGFIGTGAGNGGLKALYDQGRVAVIQGCGYPEYSLSHEESRVIWETGNPLGVGAYAATGWVGRFLADPSQMYSGSDIPAVNISNRVVGEYKQNGTSVLAIRRLKDFGFPYDHGWSGGGDDPFKDTAFAGLHDEAIASALQTYQYIGNTGGSTLLSTKSYPLLHSLYETDRPSESDAYDAIERGTARDLKEIAKVIYGVASGEPLASPVQSRFFQLSNGGYDTHSDQGGAVGQHHDLHKEVGDAVKVFFDDLETMPGNCAEKTTVVIWSEFSRRIEQNSNGTDHGSQGPMFVIGGKVQGGVYGNHPNIAESAQDDQGNTNYVQDPVVPDPFRSTDFRDVYGTILKHWLNMPEGIILANVLPADAGDPAYYWTNPNFDLFGFNP